jgi:magnesium chelatase family protein
MHVEVVPVSLDELTKAPAGESSAQIRERVEKARAIQAERFKDSKGIHCNAQMTDAQINTFATPDAAGEQLLRAAIRKHDLSARAYNRILKVARTIADLAGSEKVEAMHIAEAIGYRNLDRGDWAERGV